MENLITVVIPIYNVEKYLDRCIESIVNQTYTNLEIILVDDGSPDNCSQMCEEWVKRDPRIRAIHKENAGLGMARNTGIDNAQGKYICFFDSDDYVATDVIEKAYSKIVKEQADIVLFGFHDVDDNGVLKSCIPTPQKTIYHGQAVQTHFLPDLVGADPKTGTNANLWMSACMCIYSMELIKRSGWRFVSEREIISEDVYSLLDLYHYVKKVAILEDALYYVYQNTSSLSRSYRPDRFVKTRHFYECCLALCEKHRYPEEVTHRLADNFLSGVISSLKMEVRHKPTIGAKRAAVKKIILDNIVQASVRKKENDVICPQKAVLYFAMRHKWVNVCLLLVYLKNMSE